MTETIGILRMPMGNLRSVHNAVYENGFDPVMVDGDDDFDALSHLIVPGVGNFRAVMQHLESGGTAQHIRQFAASGRPVLGICVGMQLLAQNGTEGGEIAGLGLVEGTIERLPHDTLPLPHVGWSEVDFRRDHPVLDAVKPGRDYYFVHSYALRASPDDQVLGASDYGGGFVSIVARDNVVGFQFHPEKSQANGLALLANFCAWDGRC